MLQWTNDVWAGQWGTMPPTGYCRQSQLQHLAGTLDQKHLFISPMSPYLPAAQCQNPNAGPTPGRWDRAGKSFYPAQRDSPSPRSATAEPVSERMGVPLARPTLDMHEAGGLNTAHAVLSPAHVGPTVLTGHSPSLQRAAPILLQHPLCGRETQWGAGSDPNCLRPPCLEP